MEAELEAVEPATSKEERLNVPGEDSEKTFIRKDIAQWF